VLDEVIPVSDAIARRFAGLKAQLRARGRTKQDFDLIIAATALESGSILVTDDGALLAGDIPDLVVENWCR
jgi:predicted nucleic acid-binding protein